MGNAIKFTEQGEIVVEIEPASARDGQVELYFGVTDTGIGIPREALDRIFEKFTQADGSTTRRFGGTGLGTTISKQLVELMSGRIWADSEVGKGSTFHFTVLLERAREAHPADGPEPEQLKGLKVLMVDDNATNRRLLRETLNQWGMIPIEAPGGKAALTALEAIQAAGGCVDMAILDHHMPDMDGFELAGRIRALKDLEELPIVFLTSTTIQEIPKELKRVARLSKPVEQSRLQEAILGLLRPSLPCGLERAAAPLEKAARPLKVLLAEDNLLNQKVATSFLGKRGHEVILASNGRQAIDVYRKLPDLDLILMDVQMSGMDGLEATRIIRSLEQDRRIPIVAMTAYTMKGDRERFLEAGMDDYLPKPIKASDLFDIIEKLA